MKFFFYLPLLLLVGVASCKRNAVSLSYTNAAAEVPQLGNLIFRFGEPLATDSQLNKWDSTVYIRFTPGIKGRFRWETRDQLVFSPAEPLKPATTYSFEAVAKNLLAGKTYNAIDAKGYGSFRTPDLVLERQLFSWVKKDMGGTPVPVAELHFNYPVHPDKLKDYVEVRVEKAVVKWLPESVSPAPVLKLQLQGMKAEDKDYPVTIVLKKGLMPEGGSNGIKEDITFNDQLNSPFVLLVNEVTTEHDGSSGQVFIRTNQAITGADPGQYISIEPAVKFTVEKMESGLLLTSAGFGVENSYNVQIKPGLQGQLGGTLREPYEGVLAFGELEPSLGFGSRQAIYLGAAGQRNLELRITNVPKIKLVVSKVYENNLIAAASYGYYPQGGDDEGDYYYESSDGTFGDVLYQQVIDTRTLPKYGAGRLLQFNPQDKIPGYKGIYHISVRSTEDYWISASRFVALSDIGLIAKAGAGKMLVFANSIAAANALSGVGVQVYGKNNQLIGNGSTNADGVAEIVLQRYDGIGGFTPSMVVARLGDDFNYLPLAQTGVNTSRYQVGGKKINSTGMDVYVAPERDLYRPGETIRFAVIARDANRKSPGAVPLKMRMLMPDGKELMHVRKNLDAEGVTEGSFALPQTAITGSYTLELYNGNDVLIRSSVFRVEDFAPDRIKVTAKVDEAVLRPGANAVLSIDAINYFGPPAAGRNFEAEVQVREKQFQPEGFGRFDFSLGNRSSFEDNLQKQGKTDEGGKAAAEFQIPANYAGMGILQARFFATVFDENGRPVSRNVMRDVITQPVLIGIDGGNTGYAPLNQPLRMPLVALSPDAKVAAARVEVTVIKHEYRTVLQKSGGYFRYNSQKEEKVMQRQQVNVQGTSSAFGFIPRQPGEYEVRVALPGMPTYVSSRFYSYGSWGSNMGDFEVNSDGQVDIAFDKKAYNRGDNLKALLKAPFDGKLLLSVEASDVLSYHWLTVKNRTAVFEMKLDDRHLPNIYLSATLFKPHTTGSALPLTAAHGIGSTAVKDNSKKLEVSIAAAAASRSSKKQRIEVKAPSGSMVCLAAVDNGVLAVTGFSSPDPYQWFFSKRALGVEAWDLYPLLFPELRRTSSTGGDGNLAMDLRQNPFAARRFKLMSYWGGWKKAAGGSAEYEVEIPAFNGQVRLMAIAVSGDKFGAAESTMQVADPLVVSTSAPRFMTPGDSVFSTITISNTTDKAATVTASVRAGGPLQALLPGEPKITIGPRAEGRLALTMLAGQTPGKGTVQITVNGLGERYNEAIEMSVRPAASLEQRSGSGVINAGAAMPVKLPVSDFIPASANYSLMAGKSPVVALSTPLRYLVNYPYGCTEQVVSMAFPQLYYTDFSQQFRQGSSYSGAAVTNVQTAIQRIKMRQLYNGGITLWDTESTESWWVTAYAAHFLLEARKAGYTYDGSLLETMLQYLTGKLRKRELVEYMYNGNLNKRIAPKEVAYSLYVLALAGRPNIPAMNFYKGNQKDLALDSRYVLSATYAIAGDRKSFRELLPSAFSGEVSVSNGNGSMFSPLRDEALALNVLLEAEPTHPQVAVMAKHVSEQLSGNTYLTTQEASFGMLALGKMLRQAGKSTATAEVLAGNKKIATVSSDWVKLDKGQLGQSDITIQTSGNGKMYYWWQASGISTTGRVAEKDNYLKVRRQLLDRNGKPIAGNTFRQNDLIVVRIVLEKAFSGRLENIVVTDLLPGGWEIENARIRDVAELNWIKDETTPLARDIRDDRIHLFTEMNGNRQVFYYTVRAVTPGVFQSGPLSADAMYKPEYHSYSGTGKIRVLP